VPGVTGSGAADNTVHVKIFKGAAMQFDVVYDQRGGTLPIGSYGEKWYYDSTNMADPVNCDNDPATPDAACTKPSCTQDPGDVTDDPAAMVGVIECAVKFTDGIGLRDGYFIYNIEWTSPKPAVEANFVMDRVDFANKFTTVGSTFTLDIDTVHPSAKTQVLPIDVTPAECDTLSQSCTVGAVTAPKQNAMSTVIYIDEVPCYTGKPSAAPILTCVGAPGCTQTGGDANVSMSYTLPTGCWNPAGTTAATPCDGLSIKFTSPQLAAGEQTFTSSSPNPFTTTITDGVGQTVSTFSVVGASTSCQPSFPIPSEGASSGKFGDQTVGNTPCNCGAVPVVTLTNATSVTDKTYIQGAPITLNFMLDVDDALTLPSAIPPGGLNFYFTNNPAGALPPPIDVRSTLTASGAFSATIPGSYVVADTPIYFGVVARDTNTAEGKYPTALDITSSASLVSSANGADAAHPATISNIMAGTRFWFLPGQEPYPNQFPFRANGQVLKIFFTLNDEAIVNAQIYSLDGTMIRHLDYDSQNKFDSCNSTSSTLCNMCTQKGDDPYLKGCLWDGTTYEGGTHYVSNGMYIFNIHATSTGSNFKGSSFDYTKGIVVMK